MPIKYTDIEDIKNEIGDLLDAYCNCMDWSTKQGFLDEVYELLSGYMGVDD